MYPKFSIVPIIRPSISLREDVFASIKFSIFKFTFGVIFLILFSTSLDNFLVFSDGE